MNPRTEPLLWIQLLGLAVLPLEALLVLLVLAGSDPGPVPRAEEVLCWSLGAVAPALLLWRVPADVWSLLLVQIPLGGRREAQRRLSRLQGSLPLKLVGPALGALLALPLLLRLDGYAAIAAPLWGAGHLPRLVALLLTALLLSLMLWQWQQVVQALWLLGRPEALIRATPPLGAAEVGQTRLSLGLPLLLPPTLSFASPPARPGSAVGGSTDPSSPGPGSTSPGSTGPGSPVPSSAGAAVVPSAAPNSGSQTPGSQTPGFQTPEFQTPGFQTSEFQTPELPTPGLPTQTGAVSDLCPPGPSLHPPGPSLHPPGPSVTDEPAFEHFPAEGPDLDAPTSESAVDAPEPARSVPDRSAEAPCPDLPASQGPLEPPDRDPSVPEGAVEAPASQPSVPDSPAPPSPDRPAPLRSADPPASPSTDMEPSATLSASLAATDSPPPSEDGQVLGEEAPPKATAPGDPSGIGGTPLPVEPEQSATDEAGRQLDEPIG